MSDSSAPDPVDGNRWLYVHQDEVIGAAQAAAVDLVIRAGLHPQVIGYHDEPLEPELSDADHILLFISDDGRVRSAQSAS